MVDTSMLDCNKCIVMLAEQVLHSYHHLNKTGFPTYTPLLSFCNLPFLRLVGLYASYNASWNLPQAGLRRTESREAPHSRWPGTWPRWPRAWTKGTRQSQNSSCCWRRRRQGELKHWWQSFLWWKDSNDLNETRGDVVLTWSFEKPSWAVVVRFEFTLRIYRFLFVRLQRHHRRGMNEWINHRHLSVNAGNVWQLVSCSENDVWNHLCTNVLQARFSMFSICLDVTYPLVIFWKDNC